MNHARRQVGGGRVGPAHAEDVEVGDRLGAEARAEHVADHAAEARGRATVAEGWLCVSTFTQMS
jgi:hypothetical protein